MQATAPNESLDLVLRGLYDLAAATPAQAEAHDLLLRLAHGRLRLAVVGEAKRGKSTVVNALLCREVLPAGVIPLTAVPTVLTYGAFERVEARGPGAHIRTYPLAALASLVTESGNPRNRRGLTEVTVYLEAALLAGGIDVIDTPGTGSVNVHNTAAAEAALGRIDAAILVLSADPPVSLAELELLERVRGASAATFVLLNKTDRLDEDELAVARAFTEQALERVDGAGAGVRIYACSARTALRTGHDAGLEDFLGHLQAYLKLARTRDLHRSLARRAAALAAGLRDQARLTLTAHDLERREASERVAAFRACLDGLRARRDDALDLARTQVARLLADLNTAAAEHAERSRARLTGRLDAWLAGEAHTLSAPRLQQAGNAFVLQGATEAAEAWRCERVEAVGLAVRQLAQRLSEANAHDVAAVREAASELMGVQLSPAFAGIELAGDSGFHYAPPDPHGPAEVLATAVRTRLAGPGAADRVKRHLRASVPELIDRQDGRARAGVHRQLTDTLTALLAALTDHYDRYREELTAALGAAEALRALSAEQAAAHRSALTAHEQTLSTLIAAADELACTEEAPEAGTRRRSPATQP